MASDLGQQDSNLGLSVSTNERIGAHLFLDFFRHVGVVPSSTLFFFLPKNKCLEN